MLLKSFISPRAAVHVNDERFTLLVFTAGSLAMTPVPEQGASSNTLSKPPITCATHCQLYTAFKNNVTVAFRFWWGYLWELPPIIVADNSVGHP